MYGTNINTKTANAVLNITFLILSGRDQLGRRLHHVGLRGEGAERGGRLSHGVCEGQPQRVQTQSGEGRVHAGRPDRRRAVSGEDDAALQGRQQLQHLLV